VRQERIVPRPRKKGNGELERIILHHLVANPQSCTTGLIEEALGLNYSVYIVLGRLMAKGLVTLTRWSESAPVQGGKRQRLYAVTEAGRAVDEHMRKQFTEEIDAA